MRGFEKRSGKASEIRPEAAGRKKAGGKQEAGFALPMVLFIITMLGVLGATTMIMAVYSMMNAQSTMPAAKAFDVAEAGISYGHSMIAADTIPATPTTVPDMMGGSCVVNIAGAMPNWTITSTGVYEEDGQTYQRKIEEQVTYYGSQAFSFLQDYIMLAGHDINISIDDWVNIGSAVKINGGIRAKNEVDIDSTPAASVGDSLTFNGNVEADNSINARSYCSFLGWSNVKFNKDILTKGTCTLRGEGSWFLAHGNLYTYDDVKCGNLVKTESNGDVENYAPGVVTQGWNALPEVYQPEPNFEYYKALAKQQGNYFVGNKSFAGKLGDYGASSITVFYATGNITISSDFWFDQADMTGIFVCEGSFGVNTSAVFKFAANSKLQAIAKGDCNFDCKWDFLSFGASDQFFFYAGNNANINMGMFSGLKLSVSAKNDINLNSNNFFSNPEVNANPSFAIDVRAWPIDFTVRSWKELSVP